MHYLLALTVDKVSTPALATQTKWSRFINTHGREGYNVPADLHMEHLNKHLKRLITGLDTNCTSSAMVNISKCINSLLTTMSVIDKDLNISPDQTHHARKSTVVDEKRILEELVKKSCVFDYTPGRKHKSCNVNSSILHDINADKCIAWIEKQKNKVLDDHRYKEVLKS